jgi:hypothetical protein
MGIHADSGGAGEPATHGGSRYGRERIKDERNRTGTGTRKATRWSTFLKAHWNVFAASDFFSIEVWTGKGLVTHYVLFVISLADRIVHIAGITTQADEAHAMNPDVVLNAALRVLFSNHTERTVSPDFDPNPDRPFAARRFRMTP